MGTFGTVRDGRRHLLANVLVHLVSRVVLCSVCLKRHTSRHSWCAMATPLIIVTVDVTAAGTVSICVFGSIITLVSTIRETLKVVIVLPADDGRGYYRKLFTILRNDLERGGSPLSSIARRLVAWSATSRRVRIIAAPNFYREACPLRVFAPQ